MVDYGVARSMDHWSVPPADELSTYAPQRTLVPPITDHEGSEANKGQGSPDDSFHCSLPIFGPCPESLLCRHPGAGGRGGGQASCADEKRPPGKQRGCRDCWGKESSSLSAEAWANVLGFFFAFYVFIYYGVLVGLGRRGHHFPPWSR